MSVEKENKELRIALIRIKNLPRNSTIEVAKQIASKATEELPYIHGANDEREIRQEQANN